MPGHEYVNILETFIVWFGVIVPLCVPKMPGYGFFDVFVSNSLLVFIFRTFFRPGVGLLMERFPVPSGILAHDLFSSLPV